jgi:hypothetical protein
MRVMNFYLTLHLFLVLVCFVGSFFNVMVVGPTSLKEEEEEEEEKGEERGEGKGESPFVAAFQLWYRAGGKGGRGTFGVAGD